MTRIGAQKVVRKKWQMFLQNYYLFWSFVVFVMSTRLVQDKRSRRGEHRSENAENHTAVGRGRTIQPHEGKLLNTDQS